MPDGRSNTLMQMAALEDATRDVRDRLDDARLSADAPADFSRLVTIAVALAL